ncbi:MAG: acyltransferase [Actinomycetales bacterium]|nr:acyltransferase [Actinomycetales bacterium]
MSDTEVKSVSSKESSFRQDLVGLRGVAVLMVLLHHFEIPGFVGAFYGPDIFFVLSGFLITGSLVREYGRNYERTGRGSISFIGLYLRRARRIVPAATVVILAINIYAYFFVNEIRRHTIFLDSIWTFFFGANIRFLKEATDYFATEGVSPLVHFWSLSVTEQFYIFWPLLLLVAAKLPLSKWSKQKIAWKTQMIWVLSILIAVSFVYSLRVFDQSANQAYFSTYCRAWELAVGGAIAILTFPNVSGKLGQAVKLGRHLGLVLLFGSVFIVTPENFGHTIFIPVLACAFIVITGKYFPSDLSALTLGSLPLRSLGTISYSVYLWHWPIYVFAFHLGWMNSISDKIIGILITLILGFLTYRFVEQTFMRIPIPKDEKFATKHLPLKKRLTKQFSMALCLALICAVPANAFLKPKIMNRLNSDEQANYNLRPVNEAFENHYGVEAKNLTPSQWRAEVERSAKEIRLPANLLSPLTLIDSKFSFRSQGFFCATITQQTSELCRNGSPQSNQNPNAPKVVIYGSSLAAALVPAVAEVFNPAKYNLRGYVMPGCSIADVGNLTKEGTQNKLCSQYRPWAVREIKKSRPDIIVMSTLDIRMINVSDDEFTAKLAESLKEFKDTGAKLVLVGAVPYTANLSRCLDGKDKYGPDCFTNPTSNGDQRVSQIEAMKIVGGTYVDPLPWICTDKVCPPVINNMIVSWDGFHLTPWFSKYIGRFLKLKLLEAKIIQ